MKETERKGERRGEGRRVEGKGKEGRGGEGNDKGREERMGGEEKERRKRE